MNIASNAIQKAVEIFKKNSIAFPFLEARMLLSHILKISVDDLILHGPKTVISKQNTDLFFDLVEKKVKKIPTSYLINKREFFGNNFYIDSRVLDPRPDSETLVEMVIKKFENTKLLKFNICEIGCGSGCLIISLLKSFVNSYGLAVDISLGALEVATKNSFINKLENRLNFIQSNMFDAINKNNKFDIIISNPPYIPTNEIQYLQDEVRLHEPRIALDGGFDGLDFYRIIARDCRDFLNKDGKVFVEIGYGQFEDVKNIFIENGLKFNDFYLDLAGIIRAVEFENSNDK